MRPGSAFWAASPMPKEREAAEQFLAKQTHRLGSERAGDGGIGAGLLNTNEFLYVE